MSDLRTLFPAALAVAVVAPAALAQMPEEPGTVSLAATPRPTTAVRSRHGITLGTDGLTGIGRAYEVRFEPGRMVLQPALGRRAPRSFPLSFALESVTRGDALVHLAEAGVEPSRSGDRVVYARGPAIEERYDVDADGVRQSFLFESLPPGSGDLVVRGRLGTELTARADGSGGLAFDVSDLGGVHYGAVTGIDADGVAVAGSLRVVDDALELVLPGAFVDRAAFPLLLDPLIGPSIAVDDTSEIDVLPDAANSGPDTLSNDLSLVVWERVFSASDTKIYGQLVSSLGGLWGGPISISGGVGVLATDPAVAYVTAEGTWLVAYVYQPFAAAVPLVYCRTISKIGNRISQAVQVSGSAFSQSRPDVGGDWTSSDNEAFIVWEQEGTGIRGRTVTATYPDDGPPVANGPAFTIGTGFTPLRPRISKAVDRGVDFLVVWDADVGGGRHYVYGRMYDRDGNPQTPARPLYDSAFYDHRNPDCDGDGDAFLVAWQRSEEPLSTTPYDIVVRAITWDGSDLILDQPVRPIEAGTDDNERAPSVAMTASNAIVSYLDADPSGTNVYVKNVDPFTGYRKGELRIADGVQSLQTTVVPTLGDDVLVVWDDFLSFDIFAQLYDGVGETIYRGGSCGVTGRTVIPLAIADNDEFRIHLRNATPNVLAACVTGLSEAPIGCGSCTLRPSVEAVYYDTTDANGHASVNVPLPASYGGATFYAQWVTFVPAGACPLAPLDFSETLRTTIDSAP
ncbi:MAG: hypothetical protein KC657_13080 [Myxococcales bacterium]|nr:hypothetical protein [Myxococcales bacterium]